MANESSEAHCRVHPDKKYHQGNCNDDNDMVKPGKRHAEFVI